MKQIVCLLLLICSVRPSIAQYCAAGLPKAPLSECDYCQCVEGFSSLETGSSGVRMDVRSLYLGAPYRGSKSQANPLAEHESFLTDQFSLFYHIANTPLTAVLGVPFVVRQSEAIPNGGTLLEKTRSNGVGDISATLRLNDRVPLDRALMIWMLSGGVKFATGKTNITSGGQFLDPDLQPGTGSTDLLFGAGMFWSEDRTGLGFNLLTGITTGSDPRGHRYGNYVNGEFSARYRLIPAEINESALFVLLGLGGEMRAHETQNGEQIENSGGSVFYLAPGIRYQISMQLALDATIQIPIYQYLWGVQFGESYRMAAGVQWLL